MMFMALLSVIHGLEIMAMMRHVGKIQAVFSPALSEVIKQETDRKTIYLQAPSKSSKWLFTRLSHEIHSYQGVEIGEAAQIVGEGQNADYLIQPDGQIILNKP